jgi:alkylated DNA nucleotide flippase Atl1
VSILHQVKRRFTRPPEPVRVAVLASTDPDERVLAWGSLARDEGWLVATSRGLRVVPREVTSVTDAEVLPWHRVAHAQWTTAAQGGGSFRVTPLADVEPGVQARQPEQRYLLTDAGDLPAMVRRRVDQTIVVSQRSPLPGGGGVLLVARRIPGQAVREWTVVFDDDERRSDPGAREAARQKLADLVAADQPD